MKTLPKLATLVAALLIDCAAAHANVGFTLRSVPDGANPPLPVGIWYPTRAASHPTPVGLFVQDVAPDAPLAGRGLPLVVFSHGNGGTLEGHLDTAQALAEAGFVVAAPMHTGDNYRDQSRAVDIGGRVRALSAVIDWVERDWVAGGVDPARVGAFGFSAGGMTVLIAAGARPDLALIGPHCAAHPGDYDCRLMAAHHVTAPAAGGAQPVFAADARVRAIVVAAPALGFTLAGGGAADVRVPVQLWRADADAVLPAPDYADAVRVALPVAPEFHAVPGAGHFDFLAPCSVALARVAPPICSEGGGFDRAKFHAVFDRAVVGFFGRTIGGK